MAELLVVIAIMAVLSAILLPALNKGRSRSQAISCLNNLRQLQLSWQMYSDDNEDTLPANNYVDGFKVGSLVLTKGPSWCPGNARTDTTTANIENGLLFGYNHSTAIYHCPSDNSRVEAPGVEGDRLRTRSYSMSGSINSEVTGGPFFRKFSEILTPSPSGLFVFLDTHEDGILDAQFAMFRNGSDYPKAWIDLPSGRHDQAGNLSFADGHIERWRWQAPKAFTRWQQPASSMEDLNDLRRLQGAMRQE